MTAPAELGAVAAELYALPVGDFTAARNARAKQAKVDGDRELAAGVQALRKPTAAAWVANALVRHEPDAVERLLGLGAELRAAQAAMAGQQLRGLVRRQHELMVDLRRRAEALAAASGQSLTDAVAVQVEGTLRAAMTDPDAEAAVRSGLLTAELQSTGFGPVEVGDALAVPGAPPILVPGRPVATTPAAPLPKPPAPAPARTAPPARRRRVTVSDEPTTRATSGPSAAPRPDEERLAEAGRRQAREQEESARRQEEAREEAARRARRDAAEQDAALAESAAAEADEALRAAQEAVDDLVRRHAELSAEIDELTARLHRLEAERTTTGRDERRAHAARESAARAAATARRRAGTARRRLDELE